MLRTRTIDNDLNPKWNQSFNLLVDDLDTQSLRAHLKLLVVLRVQRPHTVSYATGVADPCIS